MENSSYCYDSLSTPPLPSVHDPFHDPLSLFTDPLSFFSSVLDLDNGIARAWWVDPLVASISFAIVINLYWYQERKGNLSAERFQIKPGHFTNHFFVSFFFFFFFFAPTIFSPFPHSSL